MTAVLRTSVYHSSPEWLLQRIIPIDRKAKAVTVEPGHQFNNNC
jgi:hypothetical protein